MGLVSAFRAPSVRTSKYSLYAMLLLFVGYCLYNANMRLADAVAEFGYTTDTSYFFLASFEWIGPWCFLYADLWLADAVAEFGYTIDTSRFFLAAIEWSGLIYTFWSGHAVLQRIL